MSEPTQHQSVPHHNGTNGRTLPWARQAPTGGQRVTTRARRMVDGLPDWEPLPPGEIVVRRPARA